MHISLISGSHRPNSQSSRVAQYMAHEIEKNGHQANVVDLGKHALPLWDEGMWQSEWPEHFTKAWKPVSDDLQKADAIVVVAPEWSGMVPAALKNFFLLCKDELMHKPGLIVGVSSGINGAYPVAELRSSSYKNTKICYIPDHLIVRTVAEMLQDIPEDQQSDHDKTLRARITYTLKMLYAYADALRPIRVSGIAATDKFRYGM